MGQIQYFSNNNAYEKIIEVGEQIGGSDGENSNACESTGLDIWAKIRCHNALALAYEYMSQYDDAMVQWERLSALYDEVERLGLSEES